MKFILFTVMLMLGTLTISAQQDPAAKDILDKVSKNTKSWKTVKINFKATFSQAEPKTQETHTGTLWQKGDSYKLVFMDAETYCNKKNKWVYMPDAEEVNLYEVNGVKTTGNILDNPQQIFNIYTTGFKYLLINELEQGAKTISEIELVPENKNVEYFKIKVYINKQRLQLEKLVYFAKDGSHVSIEVEKYSIGENMPDNTFVFDTAKYPNVTVIDMTE